MGPVGVFHGNVSVNGRLGLEITWPHRVGVVPRPINGRLGRQADESIEATAARAGTGDQILTGPGGVGKTQIVANLADRWWNTGRIDLLVWVTATSATNIVNRYAQAAREVADCHTTDPRECAARFLAWLATTRLRWLVVLDDLTEPADMLGLWPPATFWGRTIVTTRRRDAALTSGREVIEVGTFTTDESLDYLRARLGSRQTHLREAEQLAADLGQLPLALAQAVTYMLDQDLTCIEYRTRLSRRRLFALRPHLLPDDQETAVDTTWALSVDIADGVTAGTTRVVLQLAALLDPNGIPSDMFATRAATDYYRQRLGRTVDSDDARDAIRTLYRLGLVGLGADDGTTTIQVHALVQRASREATPDEHQRSLAVTAADALLELWPAADHDEARAQLIRANATALRRNSDRFLLEPTIHPIVFQYGRDTNEAGLPQSATSALEQHLAGQMKTLGPTHPDTLATRLDIAYQFGENGRQAFAAELLQELQEDCLEALGQDHRVTLTVRRDLARWQGESGRPDYARRALEELLPDCARALGPTDAVTFDVRRGIADWTARSGDPVLAVEQTKALLADLTRVLGPSDAFTLTTRAHLANWRGQAGDAQGAAQEYGELVPDFARVLGPMHPHTLTSRRYLADWHGHAGDPAGAADALSAVLRDHLDELGPDHPRTLITRRFLAHWRADLGDASIEDVQRLFDDHVRLFGLNHPQTLLVREIIERLRAG
ncbi:NB-ARC domain-containing protein [Micromonospora endolithica]|uniref:NB-ARC domain-containing protein n=1 Tax=Micromonospora endolithica TaxID=230091 RepID=UPI001315A167|nr:NB-ARC domain-containing protein [Micromonospora endolithica]